MKKAYPFLLLVLILLAFYSPVFFSGKSLQPALYQPHGIVDGWPAGYSGRTPAHTFNIDLATPAYYEWPINRLAGDLYKSWTLPLWNPYQAAGTPLLAQYSTRTFFPYQVIEDLSPVWTWDFFILGRLLVAGVFAYLFLELLGLGVLASLFGSVAYMFSGASTWFINLEEFANAAMMVPVHLFFVERLARSLTLRAVAVAALSTSLVLLAGQPETAFLVLFLGAAFFALRVFCIEREKTSKKLLRFFLANLLGLALALPQVLPFIELVYNSHHLHTADSGVGTKDHLRGFEALRILSPTITETPQDDNMSAVSGLTPESEEFYFRIFPDNGAWDRLGGYTGMTSLLVSICGLLFARDRRFKILLVFFLAFGLSIVLKNFGVKPFVWIGELPVFNQVWTQRWAGPVWTFCIAAAGAIGIAAVRHGLENTGKKKAALLLAVSFVPLMLAHLALSYIYLTKYTQAFLRPDLNRTFFDGLGLLLPLKPYFGPSVLAGSAVTALFAVSAALIILSSFWNARRLYGLLPLVALELWWSIPRGYEPLSVYLKFVPLLIGFAAVFLVSAGKRRLAALSVLLFALSFATLDWKAEKGFPERHDPFSRSAYLDFLERNAGNHRVVAGYGMLFPNYSSAVGLQDVRFINSLAITSFHDYKNRFLQNEDFQVRSLWFTGRKTDMRKNFEPVRIERDTFRNLSHYSFLGVKYLIFPPGFDLETEREGYIDATGEALPEFRQVYSGDDAVIYENPVVLPRAFIIEPSAVASVGPSSEVDVPVEALGEVLARQSGAATAQIKDYQPNLVSIEAYAPEGGVLVLTDSYYTGWRAYVDGRQSDIMPVNGVVRGVRLLPGRHLVEFRYMPASFILGSAAFAASFSLCMVLAFWRKRKKARG